MTMSPRARWWAGCALLGIMDPGHYAALCFVPLGSIGEDGGDGPPHSHEGMYTEFTVD
jgi:hypothetical protein